MFDYGAKWTPASFGTGVRSGEVTGALVGGLSLVLLSGNITSGLAAMGMREPPWGATSVATGSGFALAMARDRCLAVSLLPLAMEDGWHEDGYATTDVWDGFMVLELSGSALPSLLAQATSLDWSSSMRSAAISFAGLPAAAVFREDRHRLWLFLDTPNFPALQRWFATVIAA